MTNFITMMPKLMNLCCFIAEVIYDFPGGGMDFGEAVLETLHREVMEEIGIEIEVGKLLGIWSFMIPVAPVQILCMGYQCSTKTPDMIDMSHNPALEDIFEYQWLEIDQILNDPDKYLMADGMLDAVKAIKI
jgi:8-oxo-dGTP diphosphatase